MTARIGLDPNDLRPRLGEAEIERRIARALATMDRHNERARAGGFATERLYRQAVNQEVRRIKRLEMQREWERGQDDDRS